MSTSEGGANIVRDGLVFYVDGANRKSYVPGSTSANDLSDGGITGSLINDTNFSTDNQGIWNFDGLDDRLEINELVDITSSLGNSTFNIWVNPQENGVSSEYQWCFTTNALYPVIGLVYIPPSDVTNPGSYRIFSGNDTIGSDGWDLRTTGTVFQREWTNVCITKESGGTAGNKHNCKIYVNGVEQNTNLIDTSTQDWWMDNMSLTRFNFASLYREPLQELYSQTDISSFSVYNRTLSSSEILQNYNALKTRFRY